MKQNLLIHNHYIGNKYFYLSDTYKVRPNLHVGSATKLLEPYHPEAFRNRLPIADAPILTKNAS